uniref:G_PROTEIN_RECEP_F3_4 domain-containing protein n=1 Tax=Panagrellus redivivus TaxID=6233 RepID=A0A7E4VDU5_PANRE
MLTSMSGLHIALTVAISVNSSLNDIEQVVFIHLFINLIIVSLMIAYFTVYAVTKYFLAKTNRSMMVFAFLTFLSSIASIAYIGTLICILIYKPEYNIKHVGVLLYAILSCVRGSILFFVPFVFIWSKKQLRFAYGGLYYKLTKETDRNARISTISMSDEEFHFMTLRSQWNDKYNEKMERLSESML